MTVALAIAVVALALALCAVLIRDRLRSARPAPASPPPPPSSRRILFPFVADALSRRALDAALRIARAEEATLMPVFLACVPRHLPLDATLPRQSGLAIATQEAIDQRAACFGVPVDARVARGRSSRHALRQAIADERYGRIVIAAAGDGRAQRAPGFGPDDVAWLLANAPGEIVVLRPGAADGPLHGAPRAPTHVPADGGPAGHSDRPLSRAATR